MPYINKNTIYYYQKLTNKNSFEQNTQNEQQFHF